MGSRKSCDWRPMAYCKATRYVVSITMMAASHQNPARIGRDGPRTRIRLSTTRLAASIRLYASRCSRADDGACRRPGSVQMANTASAIPPTAMAVSVAIRHHTPRVSGTSGKRSSAARPSAQIRSVDAMSSPGMVGRERPSAPIRRSRFPAATSRVGTANRSSACRSRASRSRRRDAARNTSPATAVTTTAATIPAVSPLSGPNDATHGRTARTAHATDAGISHRGGRRRARRRVDDAADSMKQTGTGSRPWPAGNGGAGR